MIRQTKFMLAIILLGLVAYLLWSPTNTTMLEEKVKLTYELANPGQTVTEITLVREGAVYKAVFKLDGKLKETYIDPLGTYIFPVRSDIEDTVSSLQSQKNFFTCLAQKNTYLFGVVGNNYTTSQIKTLGASPYVGLIYFDCGGDNTQLCLSRNITSVPSWVINNQYINSALTPAQVAQLTNCTVSG